MTDTKMPRAVRQRIRHLEEENTRLRDMLIEAEDRARQAIKDYDDCYTEWHEEMRLRMATAEHLRECQSGKI